MAERSERAFVEECQCIQPPYVVPIRPSQSEERARWRKAGSGLLSFWFRGSEDRPARPPLAITEFSGVAPRVLEVMAYELERPARAFASRRCDEDMLMKKIELIVASASPVLMREIEDLACPTTLAPGVLNRWAAATCAMGALETIDGSVPHESRVPGQSVNNVLMRGARLAGDLEPAAMPPLCQLVSWTVGNACYAREGLDIYVNTPEYATTFLELAGELPTTTGRQAHAEMPTHLAQSQ